MPKVQTLAVTEVTKEEDEVKSVQCSLIQAESDLRNSREEICELRRALAGAELAGDAARARAEEREATVTRIKEQARLLEESLRTAQEESNTLRQVVAVSQ